MSHSVIGLYVTGSSLCSTAHSHAVLHICCCGNAGERAHTHTHTHTHTQNKFELVVSMY